MLGRNKSAKATFEKEKFWMSFQVPHCPLAKEFEDQEKEIEKAAAEERERRKELGMDFDKATGQILWGR